MTCIKLAHVYNQIFAEWRLSKSDTCKNQICPVQYVRKKETCVINFIHRDRNQKADKCVIWHVCNHFHTGWPMSRWRGKINFIMYNTREIWHVYNMTRLQSILYSMTPAKCDPCKMNCVKYGACQIGDVGDPFILYDLSQMGHVYNQFCALWHLSKGTEIGERL